MKKNLFLFLIFLSTNLFATNYYVSNSGNDNNSGTSTGTAWATLSKVQAEMVAGTLTLKIKFSLKGMGVNSL